MLNKLIKFFIVALLYKILLTNAFAVSPQVDRYFGTDKYMTNISVDRALMISSDHAVLSNDENYADTLAAVTYATATDSHLFLTGKTKVSNEVKNELREKGITRVTIIGGDKTVSNAVLRDLKSEGYECRRISGANRYSTSRIVADMLYDIGQSSKIIFVSGDDFSDAAPILGFAVKHGYPIIMADKNGPELSDLKSNSLDEVILVGGRLKKSKDLESYTSNLGIKLTQILGKDRYETSLLIAERYFQLFDAVVISNGRISSDTYSASILAANAGHMMLLCDGHHIDERAIELMTSTDLSRISFVGGNTVDKELINNLLFKLMERSDGTDRENLFIKVNSYGQKIIGDIALSYASFIGDIDTMTYCTRSEFDYEKHNQENLIGFTYEDLAKSQGLTRGTE